MKKLDPPKIFVPASVFSVGASKKNRWMAWPIEKTRWQLYFLLLVMTLMGGGIRRIPALAGAFALSFCSRLTDQRLSPASRCYIGMGLMIASKCFCSLGWATLVALWWLVYWSGATAVQLTRGQAIPRYEALLFGKLLGVALSALYAEAQKKESAEAPWCEAAMRVLMVTVTLLLMCLEGRTLAPRAVHHNPALWWAFGGVAAAAAFTSLHTVPGQSLAAWVVTRGVAVHWQRVLLLTSLAVGAVTLGCRWIMVLPPESDRHRWQKWRYYVGRKYFHAVVSCLLVALMRTSDRNFASFVLLGILSVYMLIEAARIANLAGLGDWIERCLRPYTDERDRGVLIITPFLLLLGVAITVFMEVARGDKFDIHLALTGMLATGVGDSVAALLGIIPGHDARHIRGMAPGKTLHGTVSFIVVYVGMAQLVRRILTDNQQTTGTYWAAAIISGVGAGITEAMSASIDNVYVSMVAYALARFTVWFMGIIGRNK